MGVGGCVLLTVATLYLRSVRTRAIMRPDVGAGAAFTVMISRGDCSRTGDRVSTCHADVRGRNLNACLLVSS